jgi:DUF4097 and DUF4098 domain-containing protein YvlB
VRRDEHFPVDARARLEVNVPAGAIQVHAGDDGAVDVSIESTDAGEFEVSCIGSVVSVVQPSRWGIIRARGTRVVVRVPPGTDVEARSASADIELRGMLGAVRLRTASGDVDAEHVGRLEAHTASGNARVAGSSGDASFNTASGDVSVGRVDGRLTASLASGDLHAGSAGGSIDVGTASGDVSISRCDGDEIIVKTVSGDIHIGLPAGIRVEPEIATLSGRTSLPQAAARASSEPRRIVRVRLRSISGDIRVDRLG